jgi:hypothetical protein
VNGQRFALAPLQPVRHNIGIDLHHVRLRARGQPFLADGDIDLGRPGKALVQHVARQREQRAVVPPQARTDDQVAIEQRRLLQQDLGRQQPAERLAD